MTKLSALYRENAEDCAQMAEAAEREQDRNRYERMGAAWLALAEEQDWLDGERPPVDLGQTETKVRRKRRPSSASKLAKIDLRRQIAEFRRNPNKVRVDREEEMNRRLVELGLKVKGK